VATSTAERFSRRDRRDTTFIGGRPAPIHRWFTIPPAFAPALVADCAAELALQPGEPLLDPFVGAGTTAVWGRLNGHPVTAVEWNPALAHITAIKAGFHAEPARLAEAGQAFATAWLAGLPAADRLAESLLAERAWWPPIAYPERWWQPPALAALAVARRLLARQIIEPALRPAIELALLALLVPVSRARYSHASLTFDTHRSAPSAEQVVAVFGQRLALIVDDLAGLSERSPPAATVIRGNSLYLDRVLPVAGEYGALICSPPYPNRYSYARETRPHLFFLDLIESAGAVGQLEVEALGGTWGRATARLQQPHTPEPTVVAPLMAERLPRLRAAHPLMANYAIRYVNDLWQHIQAVSHRLAPRARCAYVIGNSLLGGVEVPAAEWLLKLFQAAGWRPRGAGVYLLRRRNSRPGLTESVVLIER
jgi:hypothetical protein